MPEYLTIDQVAERYHTTRSALYQQRLTGLAPGNLGVLVGKRLIWRASDLEAWFDSRLADAGAVR